MNPNSTSSVLPRVRRSATSQRPSLAGLFTLPTSVRGHQLSTGRKAGDKVFHGRASVKDIHSGPDGGISISWDGLAEHVQYPCLGWWDQLTVSPELDGGLRSQVYPFDEVDYLPGARNYNCRHRPVANELMASGLGDPQVDPAVWPG